MSVFCCCRTPLLDSERGPERLRGVPIIHVPSSNYPGKRSDNLLPKALASGQRQTTTSSLCSANVASSNSFPKAAHDFVQFAQPVVHESIADDGVDDLPIARHLYGLRSRFIRSRSRDDSNRSSRASVGTSEEEIARRAELKRLMHRRIRDELTNDQAIQIESGVARGAATKSLASHITPGGPRDALEFTMAKPSSTAAVPLYPDGIAVADAATYSRGLSAHGDPDRRRNSCPHVLPSAAAASLPCDPVLRKRASLPGICLSSIALNMLDPTTEDNTMPKSRHIFAAGNLACEADDANVAGSNEACSDSVQSQDGISTLATWLLAYNQGLSICQQQPNNPVEHGGPQRPTPSKKPQDSTHNLAVPSGGDMDLQELVRLYTVDLPNHLSRQDLISQAVESAEGIQDPPYPNATIDTIIQANAIRGAPSHLADAGTTLAPRIDHLVTEKPAGSDGIDGSDGNEGCTALYPSTTSIQVPAPRISVTNGEHQVRVASFDGLQLCPSNRKSSSNPPFQRRSCNPIARIEAGDRPSRQLSLVSSHSDNSHQSLTVPTLACARGPTVEARSSIAASETSSYRQREAELKSVKTRFGHRACRRAAGPSRRSKFKEEFDRPDPSTVNAWPPVSWSKFPSYTRFRRTAAASHDDGVIAKDFAVTAKSREGPVRWITNKEPLASAMQSLSHTRSFSGRLGRAIKSGLERLLPPKAWMLDEAGFPLKDGRVSRSFGQLEYPELDILPTRGGYWELKALAQGVEVIKCAASRSPEASHNTPAEDPRPVSSDRADRQKDDCEYAVDPIMMGGVCAVTSTAEVYREENPQTTAIQTLSEIGGHLEPVNHCFITPSRKRLSDRLTGDSMYTYATAETDLYATPRDDLSSCPSLEVQHSSS